ncbi:MAG TPA: arginine--tRNA ligase [Chitinophagales bacterium]|nr:arginine--tRNA ligase [Chitinophagales bacterium]
MNIEQEIRNATIGALKELYNLAFEGDKLTVNVTPPEFSGDFSVVTFPLSKMVRKSPDVIANEIGNYLKAHIKPVDSFSVIKGYLNLTVTNEYWLMFLKENSARAEFGRQPASGKKIVLEYCGPNTNKPLHLGHVRNMLLGYSLSNILQFNGHDVTRVNIYNDRGIAICKSMVAWLRSGMNETPVSSGIKGDHLVGNYYVEYDRIFKKEKEELMKKGMSEEEAERQAPVYKEAQEMLRKWEAHDRETLDLWSKMNSWVYAGFEQTYKTIGVSFDKNYYESETYVLGKNLVLEGLEKGVFYKKEDGSVWVNLSDKGLDEKVLLRSDGTSVYLTQDLGTAQMRYDEFKMDQSIYVVANEQDYHFQVLKLTLEKLGKPYASGIYHLSYGMVDLPSGKMKSREGTVVDADDLLDEMFATAEKHTRELGKIEEFNEAEARELFRKIGLGALKFFILKVDPKKRMLFDPNESIDFHGNTGPFIQYTFARISSVLRKAGTADFSVSDNYSPNKEEKELLVQLHQYPSTVKDAGAAYSPSLIANYAYGVAKTFNKFYTDYSILNAESPEAKGFRLALSRFTANVIKSALGLLGIEAPERM